MTGPAPRSTAVRRVVAAGLLLAAGLVVCSASSASESSAEVIARTQPKLVKIYGAGGFRRLEAYQSGMLISPEGHVLTVWSYVLDTDRITVTLDDGRRFRAELLGADPQLEVAVLKIDAEDLACFDLSEAVEAPPATPVLAFSNLFGIASGAEPVSALHGYVSVKTRLAARRGAFETPYRGEVYVVDAMTNNPGAAGGALTDDKGRLVGMLGKELRNSLNNTWLNYAVPISKMESVVEEIRSGQFVSRPQRAEGPKPDNALDLATLGLRLVPDVLPRTPPFVDVVRQGSPAQRAGLRVDDLVLFVGERLVQSCRDLVAELALVPRDQGVKLTVMRGERLVEIRLSTDAGGSDQ